MRIDALALGILGASLITATAAAQTVTNNITCVYAGLSDQDRGKVSSRLKFAVNFAVDAGAERKIEWEGGYPDIDQLILKIEAVSNDCHAKNKWTQSQRDLSYDYAAARLNVAKVDGSMGRLITAEPINKIWANLTDEDRVAVSALPFPDATTRRVVAQFRAAGVSDSTALTLGLVGLMARNAVYDIEAKWRRLAPPEVQTTASVACTYKGISLSDTALVAGMTATILENALAEIGETAPKGPTADEKVGLNTRLGAVVAGCSKQLNWTKSQEDRAREYMIARISQDFIDALLAKRGMSLEGIEKLWAALPPADRAGYAAPSFSVETGRGTLAALQKAGLPAGRDHLLLTMLAFKGRALVAQIQPV